ncbi:MAG: PBP1A family penicillin-binding protein [Aquificae bacterium]|nr:PBP1A family penicillin-binding protein [Aquificota bacterium]
MVRFFKYILFFLIFLVFVGVLAVGGILYVYSRNLPDVRNLERWKPVQVSKVYASDGSLITQFFIQRRVYVSIDKIPDHVKNAFISIEDRTFYSNPGIDVVGILRAAVKNLSAGRIVAGGSTISQQLIKNLFLTPERSFRRKVKEVILAIKLNQVYPKEKILEMYLNQIYLGHGAYGVEAASQVYFGKHVWELNVCEAAVLAGLPKAPSRYDPFKNMEGALNRRNAVLKAMVEEGYIDIHTAKECFKSPIVLKERDEEEEDINDYFTEMVRLWFVNKFGSDALYKGGYKIYTTIDKDLLRDSHYIIKDHLEYLQQQVGFPKLTKDEKRKFLQWYEKQKVEKLKPGRIYIALVESRRGNTIYFKIKHIRGRVSFQGSLRYARRGTPFYVRYLGDDRFEFIPFLEAAAVSIEPKTGAIRSLVGGYDFGKTKFNRAVQGKRQPGSSFKPFVYTTAIMKGYTQITQIEDEPVAIWDPTKNEEWVPRNYHGEYNGTVILREALARSLNAASVNLFLALGYDPVISLARQMGIKSKLPKVPSLVLGSAEVSPLEMAGAYNTFANGGIHCEPYFVEKVVDANGMVVYHHTQNCKRVIPEGENAVMVDMLQAVVKEGTGRRATILGFPVAGKTGTTNDYTDAWFAGFSTNLTTVVWVGYDFKKTIGKKMTGARAALPIWIDIMATAHTDKAVADFPMPYNTIYVPIDMETLKVANAECLENSKEILFIKGTQPDEDCSGNEIYLNGEKPEEEDNFILDMLGEEDGIQTAQ